MRNARVVVSNACGDKALLALELDFGFSRRIGCEGDQTRVLLPARNQQPGRGFKRDRTLLKGTGQFESRCDDRRREAIRRKRRMADGYIEDLLTRESAKNAIDALRDTEATVTSSWAVPGILGLRSSTTALPTIGWNRDRQPFLPARDERAGCRRERHISLVDICTRIDLSRDRHTRNSIRGHRRRGKRHAST